LFSGPSSSKSWQEVALKTPTENSATFRNIFGDLIIVALIVLEGYIQPNRVYSRNGIRLDIHAVGHFRIKAVIVEHCQRQLCGEYNSRGRHFRIEQLLTAQVVRKAYILNSEERAVFNKVRTHFLIPGLPESSG